MDRGGASLRWGVLGLVACGTGSPANPHDNADAARIGDGMVSGPQDGARDTAPAPTDAPMAGDSRGMQDASMMGDAPIAAEADAPVAFTCAGSSYLFCEDFESYPAGPATSSKWQNTTASSMDTLTIGTTHARRAQSLHVHVNSNEFAYIKVSSFSPPNNSFFGRVYTWVTAFPSAPAYAHFTMVEAAGQPSSAGVIRPIGGQYDPQGMAADWGVGTDQGPTGDWTNWKPSAPTQAGAWLCLEWEMESSNNAINVWVDGVAKTDLSVTTTMHGGNQVNFTFPTWSTIWFGWWLYQANPTPNQYDVWYDDLVLSTTRVGC